MSIVAENISHLDIRVGHRLPVILNIIGCSGCIDTEILIHLLNKPGAVHTRIQIVSSPDILAAHILAGITQNLLSERRSCISAYRSGVSGRGSCIGCSACCRIIRR